MNNLAITPERGEIERDFSQKEIDEIVEGLINGSIKIEDVPSCVHSSLFTPLSLARNEAKLGNVTDRYNNLNNIIWSLKLTLVQPDKNLMPQMGPSSTQAVSPRSQKNYTSYKDRIYSKKEAPDVSLVSAMKNEEDFSNEAIKLRLKGNIDTTRKFYEDEEKHLNNMREKEYKELCKTHKMQTIPSDSNEAKRAEDEFELQLVESRNKWDAKMRTLRENKEREISEMETELSYYEKPPQAFDDFDFSSYYQNEISNTVQISQNESQKSQKTKKNQKAQKTQKIPQSPKRMAQTLQPKKNQK